MITGRNPDLGVVLRGASRDWRRPHWPCAGCGGRLGQRRLRHHQTKCEEYLAYGLLRSVDRRPLETTGHRLDPCGDIWDETVFRDDQSIAKLLVLPGFAATVAELGLTSKRTTRSSPASTVHEYDRLEAARTDCEPKGRPQCAGTSLALVRNLLRHESNPQHIGPIGCGPELYVPGHGARQVRHRDRLADQDRVGEFARFQGRKVLVPDRPFALYRQPEHGDSPPAGHFDERLIDRRYRVVHDCRVKGANVLEVERLASSRVITSVGELTRRPLAVPWSAADGPSVGRWNEGSPRGPSDGLPRSVTFGAGNGKRTSPVKLAPRLGDVPLLPGTGPDEGLKSGRDSPHPVQRMKPVRESGAWRSSTRAEAARKSAAPPLRPAFFPRLPPRIAGLCDAGCVSGEGEKVMSSTFSDGESESREEADPAPSMSVRSLPGSTASLVPMRLRPGTDQGRTGQAAGSSRRRWRSGAS